MESKEKPAVLIIDDDEVFRHRLGRAFISRGWEAQESDGLDRALAIVREFGPDLAIVDLRLRGESGLDIVRALRGLDSTVLILMLTGYGSIAKRLKRSNAVPIITLQSQSTWTRSSRSIAACTTRRAALRWHQCQAWHV